MITVFHFLFWTMNQVIKLYQSNFTLETEREIDENYFEENKVKYNNAREDAETGLKFDPPVYLQRYSAVQEILLNEKWRNKIVKVVDFGCAELKLFMYLKSLINIQEVLLVDVDEEILNNNAFRVQPFNVDYLERRNKFLHVEVIQGSVDCPDLKLISVDAVICIEIIEHLYPDTLDALPHNIFHFIQPRIALFTTPNADFNVLFPNFSGTRHYDHKFEWTRQQFQDWARNIVTRYPIYSVSFVGIGPGPKGKEHLGSCSQMAVFIKNDDTENELRLNLVQTLSFEDCKHFLSEFISFGVCTYQSYVSDLLPNKYRVISEVDFPYDVDERTEEEIILHETEYRLHRLACYKKDARYESEDILIPLYELTSNRGGKFISAAEIRAILQKAGWKIEDFDIDGALTPCVIYETSASSVSSFPSPSPNLNFSTEANWDSESQWDLESTENWDENISIMDKEINESTGDAWEDASSHEHSNTRVSDTVEGDSPFSDPCISGEPAGATDERIELLFDSGYQVSTSSIELSPELSKDWLSDEAAKAKPETDCVRCIKSEKECNQTDESNASAKKSEGYLFKQRKKNKVKLEDPLPIFRNAVVVAPPVQAAEIEIPVVVENGDLANNNRDLEGNNYQAAENHVVQVDDNALPRPDNLDEHNENHIVMEQEEYPEDDDAVEVLEDASREVLFDPNSELNLSDDAFAVQGQALTVSFDDYSIPLLQRIASQPRANSEEHFRTAMGFPTWLLQMLNINREDREDAEDEENAHFYSQGDGVGVHPSTTEVSEDSSSSSSHTTAERDVAALPATAEDTSATESNYEDALDSMHASGSQEQAASARRDTDH